MTYPLIWIAVALQQKIGAFLHNFDVGYPVHPCVYSTTDAGATTRTYLSINAQNQFLVARKVLASLSIQSRSSPSISSVPPLDPNVIYLIAFTNTTNN